MASTCCSAASPRANVEHAVANRDGDAPVREALVRTVAMPWISSPRSRRRTTHVVERAPRAEVIGEDLEGFWEAEGAEGGARLLVGPSIRLAPGPGRAMASSAWLKIPSCTRHEARTGAMRRADCPRPIETASPSEPALPAYTFSSRGAQEVRLFAGPGVEAEELCMTTGLRQEFPSVRRSPAVWRPRSSTTGSSVIYAETGTPQLARGSDFLRFSAPPERERQRPTPVVDGVSAAVLAEWPAASRRRAPR